MHSAFTYRAVQKEASIATTNVAYRKKCGRSVAAAISIGCIRLQLHTILPGVAGTSCKSNSTMGQSSTALLVQVNHVTEVPAQILGIHMALLSLDAAIHGHNPSGASVRAMGLCEPPSNPSTTWVPTEAWVC